MTAGPDPGASRNDLGGRTRGHVVQTGSITGDVHLGPGPAFTALVVVDVLVLAAVGYAVCVGFARRHHQAGQPAVVGSRVSLV